MLRLSCAAWTVAALGLVLIAWQIHCFRVLTWKGKLKIKINLYFPLSMTLNLLKWVLIRVYPWLNLRRECSPCDWSGHTFTHLQGSAPLHPTGWSILFEDAHISDSYMNRLRSFCSQCEGKPLMVNPHYHNFGIHIIVLKTLGWICRNGRCNIPHVHA